MKILIWAIAFVCVSGAVCRAQLCGEEMKQTIFSCVYESCSDSVTTSTPFGDRILFVSCEAVECCKQLFTTCYFTGDSCSQVVDAALRERLAQVAASSRVLVADCRGHYALYEPRPSRGQKYDSVLVNEHILR
jgi:hypothetical protein